MKFDKETFKTFAFDDEAPSAMFKAEAATLLVMKLNVGKAKYIYASRVYSGNEKPKTLLKNEYKLQSIVSEGKIYVINNYDFPYFDTKVDWKKDYEKDPDYINYSDFSNEVKEYIKTTVLPKEWEALKPKKFGCKTLKQQARAMLLHGTEAKMEPEFFELNAWSSNLENLPQILCGYTTVDKFANTIVYKDLEKYQNDKNQKFTLKSYLEHKDKLAEEWEIRMAEALRSVDAVNVQVTFARDGKEKSISVPKDNLFRLLVENDYFSSFNFSTSKAGDELLEFFDADKYTDGFVNRLFCRDIKEITFRGKAIYVN